MKDIYYSTAQRVGAIPIDIIITARLCHLWEPSECERHPPPSVTVALEEAADREKLRQSVLLMAKVAALSAPVPGDVTEATELWAEGAWTDAQLVEVWAREVARRAGDTPYEIGCPWWQLPTAAKDALDIPALIEAHRRLVAGLPLAGPLAARPMPQETAPRFGHPQFEEGRPEIIIVGDPRDATLPENLLRAADLLGDRADQVSWVWMHAPTLETPVAVVAGLQRDFLLKTYEGMDIRRVASLLRTQGIKYIPSQSKLPKRAPIVLEDLAILDACGVPRYRRPALVVDRTLHIGEPGPAFLEALKAMGT